MTSSRFMFFSVSGGRRLLRCTGMLSLSVLLFLVLTAIPAAGTTAPEQIQESMRWQGNVELAGPVEITSGVTLRIAPGTRITARTPQATLQVAGALLVEGTAEAPVIFLTPAGWQGISLQPGDERHLLAHVRFAGAARAVEGEAVALTIRHGTFEGCRIAVRLVRGASGLVENSRFIDNGIGVDVELRSVIEIRDNEFHGQKEAAVLAANSSRGPIRDNLFTDNRQGIALLQRYPGRVSGNRFLANDVGVSCSRIQEGTAIVANLFEKNEIGLKSEVFSRPQVSDNRFVGNAVAVRSDQFGGGEFVHNAFLDNGTALHNSRKANPRVAKNLFADNRLALFCDYSSYPQVRENNFVDNAMAVRLGDFQSAAGANGAAAEMAARRAGRSPFGQGVELPQDQQDQVDFVDVSGNWWGEDARLLAAAGKDGNVSIFFDRRDRPEVTYEDSGARGGRLDWVKFAPWLEAPVPEAGPRDDLTRQE